MTKTDMPDVPIAIVHLPGQEPGVIMPLSACARLIALARQSVEVANVAKEHAEVAKRVAVTSSGAPVLTLADLESPEVSAARERLGEKVRQIAASLDTSSLEAMISKMFENIEPLRESLAEAIQVATLIVPDEDEDDRIALEEARRRDEETVPHALVKRLIAGDHPVKVYREQRGLTQAQLAARTGLSAMYLSQIETGRRGGSARTLAKIARALHVDLDDLASWDEDDEAGSDSPRTRQVKRAG